MTDLASTVLTAAGWTVLHLLWQAVAIAAVYAAACRWMKLSTAARYQLGLASLCTLLVLGAGTGLAALVGPTAPAAAQSATASHGPVAATRAVTAATTPVQPDIRQTSAPSAWHRDERLLQMVGAGWLALVVFSAGAVLGTRWLLLRRSRAGEPLPQHLEPSITALVTRLELQQSVRVLQADVPQPLLFGTRQPVVLVPPALIKDLSSSHLEAVLAHEFAHISRHDYLTNLAQVAAEILLARHPAVLWISRAIRRDREICCDALAAKAVGSRRVVAEALARLEQRRNGPFQLAPAATEGDLVQRVRCLLRPADRQLVRARGWTGALVGGVALAVVPLLAVPVTLPSPVPSSALAAPHLVLGGVDPVALLQDEEAVGALAYERTHDGMLYRFVSQENANIFDSAPQTYAVVNVDICPITGEAVLSDVFEVVDGRIYLFCCDSASEIPRPALEAIVRAGGIEELIRAGGAERRVTPSGMRQLVILHARAD